MSKKGGQRGRTYVNIYVNIYSSMAAYVNIYSSIGQISVLYAECYMIHLDSYVPVVPLHAACEGLVSVAYPVR